MKMYNILHLPTATVFYEFSQCGTINMLFSEAEAIERIENNKSGNRDETYRCSFSKKEIKDRLDFNIANICFMFVNKHHKESLFKHHVEIIEVKDEV